MGFLQHPTASPAGLGVLNRLLMAPRKNSDTRNAEASRFESAPQTMYTTQLSQITTLRTQAEGYKARMILLQDALTMYRDKADQTQQLHQQEVDSLSNEKAVLRRRLHQYIHLMGVVEKERDDLRASVVELVHKGAHASVVSKKAG